MTDDADQARLRQRLATLPMVQRAVFLLHRIDDLSYGQIGFRLGISRARVAWHMTRAIYVMAFGSSGDE
ncbi:RNA polymerase sigma factor [Sphingomonas sp.]|uniref:RNA polymerase sigma factor n=1 Tax=Sphingomonas sp. TaxID=28214 RepID=UPI003D6CA4F5